jgi:hypothetical protein
VIFRANCAISDMGFGWSYLMTVIEIELPDDMANAAREAGLLETAVLERMLAEAIRVAPAETFLSLADQVAAAGIPEKSIDEINREVKAARAVMIEMRGSIIG